MVLTRNLICIIKRNIIARVPRILLIINSYANYTSMSKRFGEKKINFDIISWPNHEENIKKITIWGLFTIVFIYVRDKNTKIWGKYENLVRFHWSLKGPDSKKICELLRRIWDP